MQSLKSQIPIPRRSSCCAVGREPLMPGSDYISYLSFDGALRRDVCLACWEKIEESQKKREGHFWRGKIPSKMERPDPFDVKALKLFRDTFQAEQNPQVLFVLALYLQRRKQLILLSSTKKSQESLFELIETGEVFALKTFHLKEEEMAAILQEIMQWIDKLI